jgi:ABC-type nitrate/sulfonate/bicarbonate transport system permease component
MTARAVDARWPISVAFAAVVLLIWQWLALGPGLPDYILSPAQIVSAFFTDVFDGNLLSATRDSLARMLPGFAIGTTIGVVTGLLAGVWRPAEEVSDTLVSLTYPLPKISLFPLVVIWLGFTDTARILVISLSVFYPAFVNSLTGTRGVDRRLVWTAQNLGAGRVRTFFQVILPASLPSVLTGVRISLALSFVLTFATEAIGASRSGLGVVIQNSYNALQYEPMYAAIAMFAVLGFLADVILRRVSVRLLRGQQLETVGHG